MRPRCPYCATALGKPLAKRIEITPTGGRGRGRSVRRSLARFRCVCCRRRFELVVRETSLVTVSERRWRRLLGVQSELGRLRELPAQLDRVKRERKALEGRLADLQKKVGAAVLVEKALAAIEIQAERLNAADTQFKERDRELFERAVLSLQNRDMQTASVASTELAELRRVSRTLSTAQELVRAGAQRLRAAREVEEIKAALEGALADLEGARGTLTGLLPDLAGSVAEMITTVRGTLGSYIGRPVGTNYRTKLEEPFGRN